MATTAATQQSQSQAQYDVRAPPRRRAKGDEADEQPVFLRKAYNMITSCPPEIGNLLLLVHEFYSLMISFLITFVQAAGQKRVTLSSSRT